MSAPDILFKGIPRGFTRGYTAECITAFRPDVVVIPCTGSFSLARVALDAGVPPNRIVAGDISLYSTAIGNAIQNLDWPLSLAEDAKEQWGFLQDHLTDPVSKAAAVLFMIRVLQYVKVKPTIYSRDLQNELIVNRDVYLFQLKEQIATLKQEMDGLTYVAQDMWLTLEQHMHNPRACLLVNPPRYNGGYDRMFKGIDNVFSWEPPQAEMFREKDYARLMEMLGEEPAYTLMYYATQGEDPALLWGDKWQSVFADKPGNKRISAINWITSNMQVIPPKITRSKLNEVKGKFPIFDGEITQESKIVAIRVEKQVGDYYRDLLIHKLPGGTSDIYVALMVDGCLMSIIGLHTKSLRTAKPGRADWRSGYLTFAFTVPHKKYPRLHKLTLMSIVSRWLWEDALNGTKDKEFAKPQFVKSTMLTKHPENKTARGIMKLVSRETDKASGEYKLHYAADIEERTREETIKLWTNKYQKE